MNSVIFMQSDSISPVVWAQRVLRSLTSEMRVVAVDSQDEAACPLIGLDGDRASYEHYGLFGFENFERLCVAEGFRNSRLFDAMSMAPGGALFAWNIDLFSDAYDADSTDCDEVLRLCKVGLFSNLFVVGGGLQYGQRMSERATRLLRDLQIESMSARWFPTDQRSIERVQLMAAQLALRLEAEKGRTLARIGPAGSTWQVLTADRLLVHKVDEHQLESQPSAFANL